MNSEARKRAQEQAAQGDDRERGLYGKYRVERAADPTGKHTACRYFVLDLDHDPLAVGALAEYAAAARGAGYAALADDLERLVDGLCAPVVMQPCPECRAGKHPNCDGRMLHPVTDELTACACPCTDQGGTL